ncbi:hypothetical protein MMC10_001170 [Thelotrema lepadinum]|nr:hypothetical protein [Thelotrema lepadinum]
MPTIAVCNGTARTSKYIIELALEKGYKVKALVRSTSRFYAKTKKRDGLTAHEWSNFDDIDTLEEILQGVSTFYIALNGPGNEPTTLNADCVHSACAALQRNLSKGSQSPTKIVILAANTTNPAIEENKGVMVRFMHNNILNHQYDDLERAQKYLQKQKSWLRYVVICPAAIVDADEAASKRSEVELIEDKHLPSPMTYNRIGYAMFQAGEESSNKYDHKYMTPMPTTKVEVSFKDFESGRAIIGEYLRNKVLPVAYRSTILGTICVALGYYARMREQGSWISQYLGVDLK